MRGAPRRGRGGCGAGGAGPGVGRGRGRGGGGGAVRRGGGGSGAQPGRSAVLVGEVRGGGRRVWGFGRRPVKPLSGAPRPAPPPPTCCPRQGEEPSRPGWRGGRSLQVWCSLRAEGGAADGPQWWKEENVEGVGGGNTWPEDMGWEQGSQHSVIFSR